MKEVMLKKVQITCSGILQLIKKAQSILLPVFTIIFKISF